MKALPGGMVGPRADLDPLWRLLGEPPVVPGWATVELDRAEAERDAGAGDDPRGRDRSNGERIVEDAPDDELLGARCRLVTDGDRSVELLLEPNTEGRLAASLARFGEGYAAVYLLVDADDVERARAAGTVLSAEGRGPFGPERLVVAGSRWGPHIVLAPGSRATIER